MHIVKATVPGSSHVNPGQPGKSNNQDAIAEFSYSRGTVIVLADGCGSQPYSSTGADIGAHLVGTVVVEELALSRAQDLDWEGITTKVVSGIRIATQPFRKSSSANDLERAVIERFLFTLIVLIIDEDNAVVVCFGDGIVVIDNETEIIRPPIENSPPYIGYLLCTDTKYHQEGLLKYLSFRIVQTVVLSSLRKGLIVATDGFADILEEDIHHPALVQPKSLQRWLNILATEEVQEGKLKHGKCRDDVSLAIVRSNKTQESLLALREKIVELKLLVRNASEQISTLKRAFDSHTVYHGEGMRRFRETEEAYLEVLKHPLSSTELHSEIQSMDLELDRLMKRAERCDEPILYYPQPNSHSQPKHKNMKGKGESVLDHVFGFVTGSWKPKKKGHGAHPSGCGCYSCNH